MKCTPRDWAKELGCGTASLWPTALKQEKKGWKTMLRAHENEESLHTHVASGFKDLKQTKKEALFFRLVLICSDSIS